LIDLITGTSPSRCASSCAIQVDNHLDADDDDDDDTASLAALAADSRSRKDQSEIKKEKIRNKRNIGT
jgi:hypothetical protein